MGGCQGWGIDSTSKLVATPEVCHRHGIKLWSYQIILPALSSRDLCLNLCEDSSSTSVAPEIMLSTPRAHHSQICLV
jgi:hypothetical protein